MLAAVCFVLCALFSFPETSAAPRPSRPSFRSAQTNFTALVGEKDIKLTCRVAGSAGTRYWWTRAGKVIKKSRKYRLKKFKYLKISDVKGSDAGDYVCWAQNKVGKIQRTIKLLVLDPADTSKEIAPYFTQRKKMRRSYLLVPAGNKAKMVCSASGMPPPTVVWYKNNKRLTRLTPHKFVIAFSFLKPKDDGKYRCDVSNKVGSISMTYTVKVKEMMITKPIVQSGRKNITAYEGDNVTFLCKAVSYGVPHFQWLIINHEKNNSLEVLPPQLDKEEYVWKNEDSRWHAVKLRLVNVRRKDARSYYCKVSNNRGYDKQEFQLRVIPSGPIPTTYSVPRSAPVIQDIENRTVLVGATLSVTCEALSKRQPHFDLIYFLPNGMHTIVVMGGNIKESLWKGDEEGENIRWYYAMWTFENISLADEKRYACRAGNFIGRKEKSFNIFVRQKTLKPLKPEVLLEFPKSYYVDVGKSVQMKCDVSNRGRKDYKYMMFNWYKDGKQIRSIRSFSTERIIRNSLTISNAQKENAGRYKCAVSNEFGSVTSEFQLSVGE